jgi:hypothetical protein
MNMTKMSLKAIFMATLMLCLSVAAFTQQRPQFDALARLKHALQSANAPALSAAQEDQLKALIQQVRDAREAVTPDPALEAAHEAYQAAIFAGDQNAANTQAGIIANLTAAITSNRMKSQSTFAIQAINVLKSNQAQVDALVQKVGASGVVHLMSSLVGGGPGGFGGPGRRGGPGGQGKPGGTGGPGSGRPGAPARP